MSTPLAQRSAAAELGVLELHRDRFRAALAAFVRADAYLDAAYVAEQILTVDELEQFVTGEGAELLRSFDAELSHASPSGAERLRWLLARRLARSEQWDRAVSYYPAAWRAEAEAHRDDLHALRDPSLNNVERARLLWRMAQRMRRHGMQLRGTELDPDWTIYDGSFAPDAVWTTRRDDESPTGPSPLEQRRVSTHRLTEPRFHYRWVAAELAWQAAELLPDQHPATARVLCIAGGWIQDRDPPGADRFYKAMIARNGAVELARWADEARWFPEPDQCSMRGIDFALPPLRVPVRPPPPPPQTSVRELARNGWPLAALFALVALVGFLLIPGHREAR